MNQINAKVYYMITTGEILTITSEMQGSVTETTKEQDMEIHQQLQGKNADDIDYIELPYGTLASTFTNVKSYSVDVANKKLNIVNFTQDELTATEQQNQESQALNDRVSDISQYLQNQGTNLISAVENSIIQAELDKLSN
jgi:hypothetical protein